MSTPTSLSGDAIQAIINVSVTQSRRLVSSWLPPPTPEEIASQKTEDELAKEDAELFKPMPPRLGLGAPIPKDFLISADPKARRQAISANEHLKRKIMGRGKSSNNQEASKPRPWTGNHQLNPNDDGNEEEEEEEGRSSLGKPKRRKIAAEKKKETAKSNVAKKEEDDPGTKVKARNGGESKSHEETPEASKSLSRFGAYLDVHRAEKAKKKKKKKKKKKPSS